MDKAHTIGYIFSGVDVRLPLIQPGIGWAGGNIVTVALIFSVSVIDVGTGGLVGRRSLANVCGLGNWTAPQSVETSEELKVNVYKLVYTNKLHKESRRGLLSSG